MTKAPHTASESEHGFPARLLVKLIVYLTLMAIPLTIAVKYQYLPSDDALRHAAKAVSGKDWSEILILREDVTMDQHPGWHRLLGAVHHRTGVDAACLVVFAYMGLFIIFTMVPVPWLKRPEAWIASLLIFTVIQPENFIFRIMRGRPYLYTSAVLMIILLLWRLKKAPHIPRLVATVLLIGSAVYIHGGWYLLLLIPLTFAFAQEYKKAAYLCGCWLAGSLAGALCTGHPWTYLSQQLHHAVLAFASSGVQRQLVGEFQPLINRWPFIVLLFMVFLLHKNVYGAWPEKPHRDPLFILSLLGWILGLHVYRFWADWGLPAFLLWMSLQFQDMLSIYIPRHSLLRLSCATVLCAGLYLATTSDRQGCWSTQKIAYPSTPPGLPGDHDPDSWMPGDGGMVYSDSMNVFYDWFYENPHASWRYVLAYEPGIMTPENLKIYRDIQYYYSDPRAFAPWVEKMRPEDRLVTRALVKPEIPELEWRHVGYRRWVGRLPQ
ncbi:MAG: hypothetical protein EOM20_05140, partial [Spartobacteria bacterium]|nr:hypothetical protein [Spartobacteria bacterium]